MKNGHSENDTFQTLATSETENFKSNIYYGK